MPLYLGVRLVIAQSFARIHAANLINAGILPVTLAQPEALANIQQGDRLLLTGIHAGIRQGKLEAILERTGEKIPLLCPLTERQIRLLLAGGLLNYTREEGK